VAERLRCFFRLKNGGVVLWVLMPTPALSHDILNAALAGLEAKRSSLEEYIAQVRTLLGTPGINGGCGGGWDSCDDHLHQWHDLGNQLS
jgi:hypothetical protein